MPARISSADTTLTIWHIADSEPASFQVTRLSDGKTMEPSTPPSPHGFPVEGRPNSKLIPELQWYLESFLDYPFPPETDHAERVLKALRDWVEEGFRALFEGRSSGRMFDAATEDYSNLHLQISSDDPQVLAWPWEALRDPELGVLAHTCQIERRLNTVRDPQPLSDSLPKDSVTLAEQWYRKSLAIEKKLGNEDGVAKTYHQLGRIAQEQRDFATAEHWYRKSFDAEEKHGNAYGAATTCHQLGNLALVEGNLSTAERWYHKALATRERLHDEHGTASTCGSLGVLARASGNYVESGQWLIKSISGFFRNQNAEEAARHQRNYGRL